MDLLTEQEKSSMLIMTKTRNAWIVDFCFHTGIVAFQNGRSYVNQEEMFAGSSCACLCIFNYAGYPAGQRGGLRTL